METNKMISSIEKFDESNTKVLAETKSLNDAVKNIENIQLVSIDSAKDNVNAMLNVYSQFNEYSSQLQNEQHELLAKIDKFNKLYETFKTSGELNYDELVKLSEKPSTTAADNEVAELSELINDTLSNTEVPIKQSVENKIMDKNTEIEAVFDTLSNIE